MLRTIPMTFIMLRTVEVLKRKEIVCFFMFFFLIVRLCYKPCDDKKKLAVGFLNEKWYIVITVFKHRFTFYAENIFFSFYGKSFSGAFTNGFLPGISSPGTVFYHNTCFLVCHSFLLTIAIRTSFFLSDWQLLLLPSNSIFKYEIHLRWLPNN